MPDKKRCAAENCKKKLGLTSYPCRCEKEFCTIHSFPEKHACTFDFKTLNTNLPKIASNQGLTNRV